MVAAGRDPGRNRRKVFYTGRVVSVYERINKYDRLKKAVDSRVNGALQTRKGTIKRTGRALCGRRELRALGHKHRGTQKRRSEEHTSELQSHVNLVCRLLLEKKTKVCAFSSILAPTTTPSRLVVTVDRN